MSYKKEVNSKIVKKHLEDIYIAQIDAESINELKELIQNNKLKFRSDIF